MGQSKAVVPTRQEEGSFRDPAGQVIIENGVYLRRVSPYFMPDYMQLMESGLYDTLASKGLLITHTESRVKTDMMLVPEQVGFISYPYEWCFSMLKEAALSTLKINQLALDCGMMLKDASAYNMQWNKGGMTLIDTLSFTKYNGDQPWVAYRQFIEHFLSPLLLMKYKDASLSKLSEIYIDGIPVKIAVGLLPWRLRLRPSLLAHIYAQGFAKGGSRRFHNVRMPRRNLDALLDNLRGLVEGLKYRTRSDWEFYDSCSYTPEAVLSKHHIVGGMLDAISVAGGNRLCDMGANTGLFSALAKEKGYDVVAVDSDHDCVEDAYLAQLDILPIVSDICNPSPAIGWGNTERRSLLDRLNVDTIMALALIHHICIGNNTPLSKVAELFAGHCKNLIVEFIPPDDPKAQLLAGNKVFPPYSREIFEAEFGKHFDIIKKQEIKDSCRSVYLMFAR